MINNTENTVHAASQEHSLRAAIADVLQELKEFIETRVQMAKSELKETIQSFRVGVPLLLGALAFMATGFLLLSIAAVAIVAIAFAGSPYEWFLAFVIVGVLWFVMGGIFTFFAYNEFRGQGRFPRRTMQVLKADKVWLQNEARSH